MGIRIDTGGILAAPAARGKPSRCSSGFIRGLLASTALLWCVFPSVPLAAQETPESRSWTVGLWMGGGYQWPAGRLANNVASDNPNLRLLETVADLNPSAVAAGGVEVRIYRQELSVRVGIEATAGAEVTGQVAICDLVDGSICVPQVAPVQILSVTSAVRLLAGDPRASVRPLFSGGLGVRRFDFEIPACPPVSTEDAALICRAVTDLYRDARPHYFLRAGVGMQADAGPVSLGIEAIGTTGRYRGGVGRTDGNWYHDLRAEISTAVSLH